MHVPPAYLNTFSNLKKMLSSGCLHHRGHHMVLYVEVGSSQVVPIGIEDEGKLRMLLSQRNAVAGTAPRCQP